MRPPADHVEEFLTCLEARDVGGATELALRLADDGTPVPEVLTGLVGAAQIEVGERWHRNEYSVADEHAATAVSDAVVSVITAHAPAAAVPPLIGPAVVVVCAEGEWHLLAARLIAEVLRADGCAVTFLGASMPAAHLGTFLERNRPDVVAISCSTPLAFTGMLACVQEAHDAGLPVIAGGRAMGTDERRALTLGADMWTPDAGLAAQLLRASHPASPATPTANVSGTIEITRCRDEVVEGAMVELALRLPQFSTFTARQRERTREDFAYILQFAEASILTHDTRVFDEFVVWLDALLSARGLISIVPITLDVLRHAAADLPAVTQLLERPMGSG